MSPPCHGPGYLIPSASRDLYVEHDLYGATGPVRSHRKSFDSSVKREAVCDHGIGYVRPFGQNASGQVEISVRRNA